MTVTKGSGSKSHPPHTEDLEKGNHAVHPNDDVEITGDQPDGTPISREDNMTDHVKNEGLSRPTTNVLDDAEDPFAFFPTLSISMSSTRGPWVRRNTMTSLGRQLTRAETLQTIKTVRSRFAEARSEFDENVIHSN